MVKGKRPIALLVFMAVLLLAAVVPAAANPWPDLNAAGDWNFFTVTVTEQGTSGIFDFVVSVDPSNQQPGWGIKAFVPYVDGITTQPYSQSSHGYNAGNTAGWTNMNGGWEIGKIPGHSNDSAAFGWQTGSNLLMSGETATFSANLGTDAVNWEKFFVVHVQPPNGAQTFWASGSTTDSGRVPEPGSLALIGTSLLGLSTWLGIKKHQLRRSLR